MDSNDLGLLNVVNDFADLEIMKSQLLYAKFQNNLKNDYNEKIKIIENNLSSKAKLYGKSEEDFLNTKNNIVSKYEAEFQKIFNVRREQYISIQNEIQEIVANKMIIVANFKQIATMKERTSRSKEYQEYITKKQKFESIIEKTLESEEFNKYTKLLEELKNPVEVYNKKYIALAQKFDNYDETIIECEKKLEECINASIEEFSEMIKEDKSLMAVKKQNIFMTLINKILNKISNDSKFQKNVIQKFEKDISNIQIENEKNVRIIEEQTINLIATIEEVRQNINTEFNMAME